MDTKQIVVLIRRLISLAESGTYQCDAGGAKNITALLDVANAVVETLTKQEQKEDDACVRLTAINEGEETDE